MLIKGTIAAGVLAAALAFLPGAASAKTNLYIGVGPGWGGDCYDSYYGECGYDPYRRHPRRDYYYDDDRHDYDDEYDRSRVSCSEAKQIVRDSGYRRVKTLSCGGKSHTFRALRRDHVYRIKVGARTGRVVVISRD